MFNFDVKFITCEETLHLRNVDFKSFKYETKKRLDESIHDAAKRSYCESRGGNWRASRSRQIRQLESKLRDKNIITSEWTNESLITIVFSTGVIAYLTVKPSTLDVTQILFDRYCVGKLASPTVTGVVLSSSHIMFAHADRMATLISFGKAATTVPCRISERDPNIQIIELGGPRRTERRLSWSQSGNKLQVLIWSTATAEPAPWSPVLEDHANLHLYQIDGQQMYLKALHQLENETLLAELSQKQDRVVHIVEQINCHKNGVSLCWTRYDCDASDGASKLSALRSQETRLTLPAPARAARLAPADRSLLAACIDGTLLVLHSTAGVTHTTRASFIATDVRWSGELILAAEENGRLQCFDRALCVLHHHAKCVDLASYLRDGRRLQILATRKSTGGSCILATFNCGPLAILRITHARLLTAWVQSGRSSNAVALLRAMDWDEDGTECLWAVNKLVCEALRSGTASLSEEGTAQAALGAYLAPRAPLPPAAGKFAPPVHDLARKFFHHLLRRGRAEKALSLAVDLHAWDLCCDVRWWAARSGARALHDEAAMLAAHYASLQPHESDCSDSCSQCSSHSYSTSDAETNGESAKTEPPPLPRVSLPYPTMMPVLITQAEPASTNSIRPNLHQYLERDNTIWNTNVKETNGYDMYKSVLTNNMKNMNINMNNKPGTSKLMVINEVPSNLTTVDIPRVNEDRLNSGFLNLFKTELREEPPLYRYQMNNRSNPSLNAHSRSENGTERYGNRSVEKNKVTFSNTVTVAVVNEPRVCPETERELADSLPLCPPHKYLSAFAPLPPPSAPPPPPLAPPPPPAAGTALDYVEV